MLSSPETSQANVMDLRKRFDHVRSVTEKICQPLTIEDHVVQPVVDISPPKWHLAHTTWFFEEMILKEYLAPYSEFHPDFSFMFNSYYESVGQRVLRPNRGNMTRPTVQEIIEYRNHVTEHMQKLLTSDLLDEKIAGLVEVGINHEQQHQELLVTDLKYILGHNPLFPLYSDKNFMNGEFNAEADWISMEEGLYDIGFSGNGFHFDNEERRHKVLLHPYQIMGRLTTNGEFLEFMEDGGYQDFRWWLSEAWDWVQDEEINSPMYWHRIEDEWHCYTLSGLKKIDRDGPVTHLSYYEADAFAQWRGCRLPTEFEWEAAVSATDPDVREGIFQDDGFLHPQRRVDRNTQFLGDVWEWTASAYLPYPYYKKADGAMGEYNGKFMINQMVLRGGSCATPRSHIRRTYRNFFHPHLRWQFNGLRIARNP